MREWWVQNTGQNMLKGVEDDPSNPVKLNDATIASFFDAYPEAVASYRRIRTTLLPEEQERLDRLLRMSQAIETNPTRFSDNVQSNWNKAGVRTAGRFGGTRRGGNI